jgi:thiosulfate/3-mercaptopyruvate sulfurtransferase
MAEDEREAALAELPPSAKLVHKVLEYQGRLSQKRIVDETRLAPRTARYAISQLEEADLVVSRPATHDARQTCYSLTEPADGPRFVRDALISPETLRERLSTFASEDSSARLVHVAVDDARTDLIPGAAVLDIERTALDPSEQRLPDGGELGGLLGELGVTPETDLVLYDDGVGYYAAYVYWLLTYYGHRRGRLLDGGLAHWRERGFRTVDEPASVPTVEYGVSGRFDHVRAHRDEAVKALTRDTVLLDVRDVDEFRGERDQDGELAASARVGGHIPGARNVPLDRLFEGDRFAPRRSLEETFADAGVTRDREIIVYCGVGARSALVWFVLSELLGYPEVKNYDGSWTEWSNLVDVPVETE